MKRVNWILLFCLMLVACRSGSRFPQVEERLKQGKPLLKVGDTVLYEGRLQLIGEFIPGFNRLFATPEGRKKILDEIIENELLAQQARRSGLAEGNLEVQKQLWLQEEDAIGGAYLISEVDKRAKEFYDQQNERLFSEVEVAEILYAYQNAPGTTPEEKRAAALRRAEATRKRLTPDNFAAIAAEESESVLGRNNGGRIGAVNFLDRRVQDFGWKPLVEAAFRLKPGEISEPIATAEGVHLIMTTAPVKRQSFEEVKGMLRDKFRDEVRAQVVARLKAEVKIEYLEPQLQAPPQN
ncbi:MAG: peptidylprolyl isomerase [bacterium]